MFNKGDIVKCINDDDGTRIDISLNKRYTIISAEKYNIKILNDNGIATRYYSYRFELDIKYLRKKKLQKITGDTIL